MQEKKGISGSTVKLIAIITMFIDHFAATIIERGIYANGGMIDYSFEGGMPEPIVIVYMILRLIGRLGFPIFIFLLIEGFKYTRNRWKYLLRLAIFALVSEIPFDLAFWISRNQIFKGKFIEFGHQNVFFTLAIGMLTIICMDLILNTKMPTAVKVILRILIMIAGAATAELLRTDYGALGVFAISAMYFFRNKKPVLGALFTCIVLTIGNLFEFTSFLVLLPIAKYDGRRGLNLKYVFYAFYPVHLLLLAGVCLLLGY
ncbi:MAG: conjugal transfer protein TraX [Lachnospiraceae bacterium]|nr:conjugal transfer protein TraX [Lachnospiraceae bacterium]